MQARPLDRSNRAASLFFSYEVERLITFRLSVSRFQELLGIVLAPDCPDDLTNAVLRACTRPHGGIISIPLADDAARSICVLVETADPLGGDLATQLREQIEGT